MPKNQPEMVREPAALYEVGEGEDVLTHERLDYLEDLILNAADEFGIRLEIVQGECIWETAPGIRHQVTAGAIFRSIRSAGGRGGDCDCLAISDVLIRFPDGSFKAPDIAVFCEPPAMPLNDDGGRAHCTCCCY